jgi:hypothetical protein
MTKIEFYKIHASFACLYFKLQNGLMLKMSEIYQSRLNGITSVLVIRFERDINTLLPLLTY